MKIGNRPQDFQCYYSEFAGNDCILIGRKPGKSQDKPQLQGFQFNIRFKPAPSRNERIAWVKFGTAGKTHATEKVTLDAEAFAKLEKTECKGPFLVIYHEEAQALNELFEQIDDLQVQNTLNQVYPFPENQRSPALLRAFGQGMYDPFEL